MGRAKLEEHGRKKEGKRREIGGVKEDWNLAENLGRMLRVK
jgi:hypothetical protein